MECGIEIPVVAKFCPVCGSTAAAADSPSSTVRINTDLPGSRGKISYEDTALYETQRFDAISDEDTRILKLPRKLGRNNMLFRSGIVLFLLGVCQAIFRNDVLEYAIPQQGVRLNYGIPQILFIALPYIMLACYLFVIVAGIVGVCLARRRSAANVYRVFGVLTAVVSAGLLLLRIVDVYFSSRYAIFHYGSVIQGFYSRAMYPVFVFTALTSVLAACYIYGSYRHGRPPFYNAGKTMIILGIIGIVISICGIVLGQYLSEAIPMVAVWALVASIVPVITGLAGLSKRRSRTARFVWGIVNLVVFTFVILQTIFYAYSTILLDTFSYFFPLYDMSSFTIVELVISFWPFLLVLILTSVFAISTILSTVYMVGPSKPRHLQNQFTAFE